MTHSCGHTSSYDAYDYCGQEELDKFAKQRCPECSFLTPEKERLTPNWAHLHPDDLDTLRRSGYVFNDPPPLKDAIPTAAEYCRELDAFAQGRKNDAGKLRYDLIPPEALEALADILTYGAQKYSPGGWKEVPDAKDRYYAALMRHLQSWRMGEQDDPESGRPHLHHALACITFLVCLEANHV
jgi:hypothetical protein